MDRGTYVIELDESRRRGLYIKQARIIPVDNPCDNIKIVQHLFNPCLVVDADPPYRS